MPPSQPDGPIIGIGARIGPYEITGTLGSGGMGEVYRARDTKLGRDVAIKVLPTAVAHDRDRLARFEREARTLASLNHPNVGAIYGIEERLDAPALILELVEGPTLAERIARGRLPMAEAITIARQVAEGIEAAHERGIVHRDLKPANIKIASRGAAKVLDFGLAKIATPDDETTAAGTEAGRIVGTVGYMSPEQARGGAVDKRADVWAFGCLLFEMLSGVRPFRGDSWVDTLTAITTRPPDYGLLPPDTPQAVRRLIERCLEKDAQRRLRDIGEARIALDAIASGSTAADVGRIEPLEAARPAPERPAAPSRGRLAIVAAAALLVVIAGAAWVVWRLMEQAPAVGERLEFAISPPEGVTWGELPEDPWPSVSPDGRQLAFTGRSAAGVYSLWVRETASVAARPLPGTEKIPRAAWPFWSPDSSRIAYCDGAHITIVNLDGRPPETIDAPCLWTGGSWHPRSGILYTKSRTGLFRIGVGSGATPVAVAAPAGALFPRWLPDGRRFIYSVLGPPADAGVFLGSTDGSPARRVLPDATAADYVETGGRGYLFFVRAATLLVQRVDPASLEANGDPVALARQMAMSLINTSSFSASASFIAYRSGGAFADSTIVWMDRRGVRLGRTYADNTPLNDVALSHDEATIAFSRYNPETTYLEIWTVDVARGTEQRVYTPQHLTSNPVFAPDDRSLVIADAQVPTTVQLGASAAPTKLAVVAGGFIPTGWSTARQAVTGNIGPTGVVVIPVGPKAAPPITLHEGNHPQLSPDGDWLAYTSQATGAPEIVVERYPEGTPKIRVSTAGGFQPRWRSDGTELFFLTREGDLMAARIRTSPRLEADQPVRLFREHFQPDGVNFVRKDYAVSRDGQRFLLKLATGDPKPLTAVRNWVSGLIK